MHQQSVWTATPSGLISAPISAIPVIFTPDTLPDTTLPIYPGLGQEPNMLACIPGGLVTSNIAQVGYFGDALPSQSFLVSIEKAKSNTKILSVK